MTDTPQIDALQGHREQSDTRSLCEGLADACGERLSWRWVLPVSPRPPVEGRGSDEDLGNEDLERKRR